MFSFGVVLYEMLARRQPFQGDTGADILASVLVQNRVLIQSIPSGERRVLVDDAYSTLLLESGHLVFGRAACSWPRRLMPGA